jgi:hypothetical protein
MKKLMFLAVMAIASMGAYAQHAVGSITLQPKVALNIANLTDNGKSDPRIGLAAGAEVEYTLTDMFSLAGGILYSMQGASEDGAVDYTWKYDYLNLPMVANVYVAKNLALKAGVQFGFNMSHKLKSETSAGSNEADMPNFKSFDFSIPLGISYEYENVVLDARYNLGLTKVTDHLDSKNSVFQITLGYRFDL